MRNALLWLLRFYAYLFELALCLFLLALWIIVITSGQDNLKLGILPWEGAALTRAILITGAVGVVCCALALTGLLRWLFPLWTLFVFVMMFRGFFLSSYSFAGAEQFKFGVWLTVGALLAFLGSLSLFSRRRS